MKLELISFNLCPFVQRAVITLLEKGVDFDITYIDLAAPPAWFKAISPFGKVPALRVGDTVLFESAVINEYLDETHPPSLHPADPLKRAHNRAWIEFDSNLNMLQYQVSIAKDPAQLDQAQDSLRAELAKVEAQLGDGPYFNGAVFALIDTAYAPTLQRIDILERDYGLTLLTTFPRLTSLTRAYLARPSVTRSVVPEFRALLHAYIVAHGGALRLRA